MCHTRLAKVVAAKVQATSPLNPVSPDDAFLAAEVLGVDMGELFASPRAEWASLVGQRFRHCAQLSHPDAQAGGDRPLFEDCREASRVLCANTKKNVSGWPWYLTNLLA